MSKPVAGVAIASRCALVIRGANKPCEVLLISNAAEATGVSVPIPALPVPGKVLVWALSDNVSALQANKRRNCFFITIEIKGFKN